MASTQYWTNTQKLRFVPTSGSTHICVHNPIIYNMVPLTKAQASVPLQAGPNILSGGVEFAPGAIPMEWPELDYSEYQDLQSFHLVPSTMIDMYDNGYLGWLVLGSYEPPAGVATKVGKCKASFVVSKPANGLISTINTLSVPTLSAAVSTGGSIPSGTTLYGGLTVWTPWGESVLSNIVTVSTGATSNALITWSWTGPASSYYRKARLYLASATFAGGTSQKVKAEVYSSFTQSFTDYCGLNGVTATATTPSANQAYLGLFRGGLWQNGS